MYFTLTVIVQSSGRGLQLQPTTLQKDWSLTRYLFWVAMKTMHSSRSIAISVLQEHFMSYMCMTYISYHKRINLINGKKYRSFLVNISYHQSSRIYSWVDRRLNDF